MNPKNRKRFEKVAANRVQKIIHYLDLLSNCANRSNYEYTEEDVNMMFREINKALKECKTIFKSELDKDKEKKFKF